MDEVDLRLFHTAQEDSMSDDASRSPITVQQPTDGDVERVPLSRWDRLKAEAGLTIVENILIIGAALVILLAILAWFFPQVFQQIKDQVEQLFQPRE
jgi:hypothetical protein